MNYGYLEGRRWAFTDINLLAGIKRMRRRQKGKAFMNALSIVYNRSFE